ncbi:MAG: DUF4846 domain-containing protein [Candidatus Aminicenantes bacterium]|nr:DUF4846 domain-containing protein [Candidatus Aminicenantes bacterium]
MILALRLSPVLLLLNAFVLAQEAPSSINPAGMTIEARFPPPPGYARVEAAENSFTAYLRRLPLKPHGEPVRLHDGRIKPNPGVYAAVVDLSIGSRDLHQCADAIIRLRAEFLFSRERFDEIRFRFTSGFQAEYARWRRGERIAVRGNDARWVPGAPAGDDRRSFRRFLETVFAYAGTASLARELTAVPSDAPEIGAVFIQPGHPGHAVIVIDRAACAAAGREVFLLAQSYMPAQEIQVLENPRDSRLSPWYAAGFGEMLVTPEWTFRASDLMRFPER